jgi:hypothetical protein
MTRPYWLYLIAVVFVLILLACLTPAHAAIHPGAEQLVIRPQPAAEKQRRVPACTRARTVFLILRYSDGSTIMLPLIRQVP